MDFEKDVHDSIPKRLGSVEELLARLEARIIGPENRIHDNVREPPEEIGTAEVADILGVSKDTMLRLKEGGLLEYRNTAPPGSSRPVYAFTLRSVTEARTN